MFSPNIEGRISFTMSSPVSQNILDQPIDVIGSGSAALITAHMLLCNGFTSVQLLTRYASPGRIWSKGHVYPGLRLNKHGANNRFSALPQLDSLSSMFYGRVTAYGMQAYMESFTSRFPAGHVKYNTEFPRISRESGSEHLWIIEVLDKASREKNIYRYARCTMH